MTEGFCIGCMAFNKEILIKHIPAYVVQSRPYYRKADEAMPCKNHPIHNERYMMLVQSIALWTLSVAES